jgi:hypothetical protein
VIVGVGRRVVDRTEDRSAAPWVDAFAEAVRQRDVSACASLVRDDVRVRLDGNDVASDRDELIQQIEHLLRTRHDSFRILDRHVAGDDAFVLFAATPSREPASSEPASSEPASTDAHARDGTDRRLLGYAIAQVSDGLLVVVDCYLDASTPAIERRRAVEPIERGGVVEPVIDLRAAEPVLDLRATEPLIDRRAAEPPPRARDWRRLALPLAAVASWVVQDLLLATPVVAFAAHFGTPASFAVFAPLYAALSLVLSLLTVRLLRRGDAPREGRLARWLASSDHHPIALRLLRAGGVVGFVFSSYLLSGPPTVWALHRFAVRRDLVRCAILASVTWGVTFVLSYLVVAELVLL